MPTFTFKVSDEEARLIRARARTEKRTLSALLRSAVLPTTPARIPRIIVKKHPVSGLPYDAGGKGRPQVTDEQIKALLADFP